jgi:hypothetical protein
MHNDVYRSLSDKAELKISGWILLGMSFSFRGSAEFIYSYEKFYILPDWICPSKTANLSCVRQTTAWEFRY